VSYLKVLGVNLRDEVPIYLRKKPCSLKPDCLVKHMQEIHGLSRNPEPLIPRTPVIILLLAVSVQCAAAVGKEPLFFWCPCPTEKRGKIKFRSNSRFLL